MYKNKQNMFVFFSFFLFVLLLCTFVAAADKVQTVGGMLEIRESDTHPKTLYLRGRAIPNIENDILFIENIFRIGKNDVVLVSDNCSGTACINTNKGRFITIKPDGTYKVSSSFELGDFVVKQVDKTILIQYKQHIGAGKGDRFITIVYDNGKIKKKEGKAFGEEAKVSEKDCKELYRLYVDACSSPLYSSCLNDGISNCFCDADAGTYSYYSKDKRLNMKLFDDLCEKRLKGAKPVDYSSFIKTICEK